MLSVSLSLTMVHNVKTAEKIATESIKSLTSTVPPSPKETLTLCSLVI